MSYYRVEGLNRFIWVPMGVLVEGARGVSGGSIWVLL